MGAEFGFSGLPAGPLGTVPPAGISGAGGFAALDGDTGVCPGGGGSEALRASEIPPWAASDSKADSTQDPTAFTAPFFTSPLRPDMATAPGKIASKIPGHQHDDHHYQHQPEDTAGRVTPAPAVRPTGNHAKQRQNQDDQEHHSQ